MLVIPHCGVSAVDSTAFEEVRAIAGDLKPVFLNDDEQLYQVLGTSVAGCTSINMAIERTVTADSVDQPEFRREGRWGNKLVKCVRDKVEILKKRLHRFREATKQPSKTIDASMKLRGSQDRSLRQE